MRIRYWILVALALATANILLYKELFAPAVLSVQVLSVGKGDAVLVKTSNGKTLLIDAGRDASILRAVGSALPFWQRNIDSLILTSAKSFSVGGLPEVQSRYHVSSITKIGSTDIPYGTSFTFDNSVIKIIAPATFTVSYGSSVFTISSSTPTGVYTSDGEVVK